MSITTPEPESKPPTECPNGCAPDAPVADPNCRHCGGTGTVADVSPSSGCSHCDGFGGHNGYPSRPCPKCGRTQSPNDAEQPRAPFVIGTDVWPGLAKLAEECGELVQVIGKLIAYPDGEHPDGGKDLSLRLLDELADVYAAVSFVVDANPIGRALFYERSAAKLKLFQGWHHGNA